jgi:capsular exopolysaccharide synthesis family protein
MVASALASEGKTLTATNLALMLSRFRQRVLLVDGDLRKPSVHHLLEIENGIGLSDILKRPTGLITPWIVSPALSVVTGGHQDPDPVSLLVTGALEQFLANTRGEFDWIVVDTPPVVLFPDAGLFADRLDACVMVVNAAATTAPVAAAAVAALGRSRILGAVLNRAPSSEIAAGCDYGSYGYAERAARGRRAWWPFRRG